MVRNRALSSNAAFLCLLITGCASDSGPGDDASEPALLPTSQASASDKDTCGATQLGSLIKRHDSPALRAAVGRFVGAVPARWIAPGTAVTSDYIAERLNLILDEDGRIATLRCG
ncbi:I78 family peptidase inhibitor [Novosphingobium percolationis]|uniref:I78 family peptidase inhibitor n=1 Tax=Novosphingobium percolationis TaxID=2871811 RepID=UPI001CD6E3BE|nr:I78 family peptidase inhibitor [Novosphingobium percolationis]